MGFLDLWAVVTVLGFLCLQASSQDVTCNPSDLKALQSFLLGFESGIDGWNIGNSSSSSNCCRWGGINCSSSGRVVKLDLSKQRLTGKISESLGDLEQLRTLNLSSNFIAGPLPESLFRLPNLEAMDLSNNDLSGVIPTAIELPSVRSLDISENSVRGSIPAGFCRSLPRIELIDFSMNFIAGSIPAELGNCSSLQHISLGANLLTGVVPEDVFGLPELTYLCVADNKLSGKLSDGIGNPSKLVFLDLSMNMLSGSIPDVFHRLPNLQDLSLHSNNFTSHIPPSLSNSRSLVSLVLRNNSLSGQMTLNCSSMVSLVSLDVATNQFSGQVPDNLPSCPRLKTINLARNHFTGQVPESFRNFPSLTSLSLSNCSISNISSALAILQHCKNLTTLVLTLNFRNEELPSDPSFNFASLKALIIANCRLTGLFPQWLISSKQLQLLDLSWNQFRGTIPPWLGNFDSLFYLDLSNNTFTGEIPKNLTQLPSLSFIVRNVSLRDPTFDFPFFLRRNTSARGLQYNQIRSFPPTIAITNNNLTGPIWPEFGNLKMLHVLDLKWNNLSGTIPSNLSDMTSLECLDLSRNDLSGNIPSALNKLSFLSKFSVAYNRLVGEIPRGIQFTTFPNSSFEGNLDLCGEHIKLCPGNDLVPHKEVLRGSRRKKGVVIGMALGIASGIFVLALLLLIILRVYRRQEVDPEKEEEADGNENEVEELGSTTVILFHNKDDNKEISLNDLTKFTNDFDQANIVGCGGFGLVYKATLPDGTKVAIKRLSGDYGQMEREFQAEVEVLSRAQHPNLVALRGYCNYKNDRLLIYSYMENGSLDYWLHEKSDGPSSLDWNMRLRIAQGSARGLAYLHQYCEPHILHRDIKSSNILLDENFVAHLADFGLARVVHPYESHVTTDLVGTLGYIPPEYGQAAVATYKGDIYSFGVVLLELLTGKRPMDMCRPKGNRDMISWVLEMRRENRESEVFDRFVYGREHSKEMLRVLEIACVCLCDEPKLRPSTQQLVIWLDNVHQVN